MRKSRAMYIRGSTRPRGIIKVFNELARAFIYIRAISITERTLFRLSNYVRAEKRDAAKPGVVENISTEMSDLQGIRDGHDSDEYQGIGTRWTR